MARYLSYMAEGARAATVVEDAEGDAAAVLDNGQGMMDVAPPVDASFAFEPGVLDAAGA
jgi:hypothetical protein